MARLEIEITRSAEKTLGSLPRPEQQRLAAAMLAFSDNPQPRGSRKLNGYDDVYRLRVGPYRVLYSVEDERLVILILKIGHRRDLYR